jgi:hypothetical protein
MTDHRPRLSDDDLAIILSALRARAAMTTRLRRHRIDRLVTRLAEGTRGNPKWIHGEYQQTREDLLADDDQEDS